ncbi:histidine utilization repressor [Sphingomonas sp.]|uniref:histidine utilization repressor n=1 Tax=Sphingomonas sp. TaxID=28214 RepID=UPI001B095243|nr:histidine utilization repressor [Sphingomonas sp.]MBO9713444.1 histidine utilization repressor [Sphingomonas sp.]
MSPALHSLIRRDIERRILSGEWRPGHRIPYEHELMAQYGCARMTVNRAVSALVQAGLIERRKRAGSFVAAPSVDRAALAIPDIRREVIDKGRTYGLLLRRQEVRKAGRADAALLRGAPRVLALECLHTADGAPHALETRLINLDVVPEAADADFAHEPPGSWLLEHVPWTEAEHRITAVSADAAVAEALDLALGTACLALERRTWRGGQGVTWARQLFPGEAGALVAQFSAR